MNSVMLAHKEVFLFVNKDFLESKLAKALAICKLAISKSFLIKSSFSSQE